MRENSAAATMRAGGPVVNGWVSSADPYAAEVLSHSGLDAVTVDLQHGMFGLDGAVRLLQAVSTGPATPMARCSSSDAAEIGKLLDAGAYGVICPAVDTTADCARFVAACRYPPRGRRSFGPARGLLYGGPDYATEADDTVTAWAMLESALAFENLEGICATPGLDGVYLGPNDLALSLGLPAGAAQFHPRVEELLHTARECAHRHGVFAGVFCTGGAQARRMADAGFDLVTPGNDIGMLKAAVRTALAEIGDLRTGR